MLKSLWYIKHRPTKIEDYIFQNEAHKALVEKFIKEKSFPHLLFSGHRGGGKTALAYILKEAVGIDDADFLQLNASDDNSVDTIRHRVKNHISIAPYSPFKVVFLDEADYLTKNAQAVLRNMMEEYSDNARFILTCNHPNKIIPELKSRCEEFVFGKNIDKDQMLEIGAKILSKEKIKVKNIETLDSYLDMAYPDFRKFIVLLEQNSTNGELQEEIVQNSKSIDFLLQLVDFLSEEQKDIESVRQLLSANVADNEWEEVYRFIYEHLHEIPKFSNMDKWKKGIIIISEHLYRNGMVADPEINFASCYIRLTEL